MRTTMTCDLQYGSTGKGLVAAFLATQQYYDTVVTANMPNAGHTAYDSNGVKFVHKVLPSAIFHGPLRIMIGPGAVFSPDQLQKEVEWALDHGHLRGSRIYVHAQAVPLTLGMRLHEEAATCNKIASTAQGSMVAQIAKMARDPDDKVTAKHSYNPPEDLPIHVVDNAEWIIVLSEADDVLAEGAQGYSLGIHQDFWPYVTSRDCTPSRFMSDMALPWDSLEEVVGVARTYPIRVGNTDRGSSGDCYRDQEEITWKSLGVAPETTTVTGRVRRVFTFSELQFIHSLLQVRPTRVFLNFVNYPNGPKISKRVDELCNDSGSVLMYEGHGPKTEDVVVL